MIESKYGKIILKKELLELKKTMSEDGYFELLKRQIWLRSHRTQGITSTNATRARKHKKEYCEVCGAKEKLVAHHKSQNQEDNRPENVQTLCFKCHNELHRRLNGWSDKIYG